MKLEAVLSQADLREFVRSGLPFVLALEKGTVEINEVSLLEIVPQKGIRLEAQGDFEWTFWGIEVPVRIERIRVMLTPKMVKRARPGKTEEVVQLAFDVEIEDMDAKYIPDALDRYTAERLNKALADATLPAWDFTGTLDFAFKLPPVVQSSNIIILRAVDGTVAVGSELHLAVELIARFEKR